MIFSQYPRDVWHKIKMYNFDPYNVFLALATYDWFCGPGSHITMIS